VTLKCTLTLFGASRLFVVQDERNNQRHTYTNASFTRDQCARMATVDEADEIKFGVDKMPGRTHRRHVHTHKQTHTHSQLSTLTIDQCNS
jgi:hypothetical protein